MMKSSSILGEEGPTSNLVDEISISVESGSDVDRDGMGFIEEAMKLELEPTLESL